MSGHTGHVVRRERLGGWLKRLFSSSRVTGPSLSTIQHQAVAIGEHGRPREPIPAQQFSF